MMYSRYYRNTLEAQTEYQEEVTLVSESNLDGCVSINSIFAPLSGFSYLLCRWIPFGNGFNWLTIKYLRARYRKLFFNWVAPVSCNNLGMSLRRQLYKNGISFLEQRKQLIS